MSSAAVAQRGRGVLLVGGTSEIGLAIVRRLAADAAVRPYLLGRDRERLAGALDELQRDGCEPGAFALIYADQLEGHAEAIREAFAGPGEIDVVVLAVGALGDQARIVADPGAAVENLAVNFLGSGSLLLHCLAALREQGRGTLVVLSSAAAERPRASLPIYGAAKAGLDALAQGLADASAGSGVRVLVVRPGFVRTRMTQGRSPAPLATTPEAVAEAAVAALGSRAHTVWVPRQLRLIFSVLRHLPRPVWRRLPV